MLKSSRGIPLLLQTKPIVPTITLENYLKWYDIFIVFPDNRVECIDQELISDITEKYIKTLIFDHCFHPYLLELLASALKFNVNSIALEVAAGRWMFEYKDHSADTI